MCIYHMDTSICVYIDMHKAGWTFQGPFAFIDKGGRVVHIPTECPARIEAAFKKDLMETIAHRDIVRLNYRHPCAQSAALVDRGIFLHPLTCLYNKLSTTNVIAANTLSSIVAGGIFTNTDLVDYGYDIDPVCTQCLSGLDTIFHRCYSCPKIEARARLALGPRLYDKIIAEGDKSLLSTRCLMPKPVMTEEASDVTLYGTVNFSEGDVFRREDGKVYGDGSCLHPSSDPLSRGGFACVQISEDGSVLKAIFGCLPKSIPQNSLSAEYAALACAMENAVQGTYAGDCADVLQRFSEGANHAVRTNSPSACVWRIMLHRYGDAGLHARVQDVCKVKAHRALADAGDDSDDVRDYWGNFHADALAKEGALLHQAPTCDIAAYKADKNVLCKIAYHMVDTLAGLRESRLEMLTKASRLPPNARPCITRKDEHEFRWQRKMWMSTKCLFHTHHPSPVCQSSSLLQREEPPCP